MLYLVRHGHTEANASATLLGHRDPPLNPLGESQSALVAEAVGPIDRVISSPLRRAVQTAETFDGELRIDDRWIELDYGELDGAPIASVPPEIWEIWQGNLDWAPPGGETHRELGERVRSACEELLDVFDTEDVVVVSHVSPIKSALAWALGVGEEIAWRCYLATASVTIVGVGPAGPVVRGFNDISHLIQRR